MNDIDRKALIAECIEALRKMVSAQHAGPITDEMYEAWEEGREALSRLDGGTDG
jgi:hypothetical protein